MLDLMKKTKGAISIFLVIVLLPMLTVASVFVDTARLNLARSMAESAGDLTLNTALTNYDSELKNLYGLFATSQNMEEMMENLEDYYRESIIAAGVDSVAAEDYVGQIMSFLKESTGTDDIMKIQLTGFEVSSPAGGNLGNPAILKAQIVEFMKYRAPLSLGTGFLEALSAMKNLSKQTTLVENKNKFYDSYQDMLSTLEDAWWQIELYQYSDAKGPTGFPTGSYITDETTQMNDYLPVWKSIVEDTVKYLYNYGQYKEVQAQIYVEYVCPECGKLNGEKKTNCSVSDCGAELDKSHAYKRWSVKYNDNVTKCTTSYTEDNPADADDVLQELNRVYVALHQVKQYSTGDYKAIYQLVNYDVQTGSDSVQKIYAVCKFNESLFQANNYLKAVKTLMEALAELQGALQTCDSKELETVKITTYTDDNGCQVAELGNKDLLKSIAQSQLTAHYNADSEHVQMYNGTVNRVNNFFDQTQEDFNNAASRVQSRLDIVRDYAVAFDGMMQEKIGNLSTAITKLEEVKTALTSEDSDYKTNLKNWEDSADALSDNTMGKNDKAEIEELTSVVTVDGVQDLIDRLKKAKTSLEAVRTEIAKYTYAGKAWKDIADNVQYPAVVKMLSQWESQIKGVNPVSGTYDDVINTIFASKAKGNIALTWGDADHPDLTKGITNLYKWMHNNFFDGNKDKDYDNLKTDADKTTSADGDLEEVEKDLEGQVDENYNKPNNTATQVDASMEQYLNAENKVLPSTRWPEVLKQIDESRKVTESKLPEGQFGSKGDDVMKSEGNDGVLEQILKMASDVGQELRDTLYVAEYIMSMFSYDTIEQETYVRETGSYTSFQSFYEKQEDGGYKERAGFENYAAENKTLTNNKICPGMNYLYGSEVEYILYGDNGGEKVYATIFALRFALNAVYAFTDAEITNLTLSAATALFGVPPLTPLIPVAQAAMIIGLAIAESAYDLVQLRKGEAIPLMKNTNTFVMKPSGIANAVKDEMFQIAENALDAVVEEGYKLLNEVLEMTTEELQAMIDAGEDEIKKIAEKAVETAVSQFLNYANEAVQKVVDLCNEINQQTMLNEIYDDPIAAMGSTPEKVAAVKAKLEAWLAQQDQNDAAIYEVKKLAVDCLTADDGAKISLIFDAIEEQALATKTGITDIPGGVEYVLYTYVKDIQGEIAAIVENTIKKGGSFLSQEINEAKRELEEAAAKGAEELKAKLKEQLGSAFESIPTADGQSTQATDNALCSLLSWTYSDYLRIFVVIGLLANEEAMMLRMADMIELNMQHKNNECALTITTETTTKTVTTSRFFGLYKTTETKTVTEDVEHVNQDAFSLAKSYTYLSVHATLEVPPLLMALPFMADTVENELTGSNWYELDYTGLLGY